MNKSREIDEQAIREWNEKTEEDTAMITKQRENKGKNKISEILVLLEVMN